MGVIAVLDVLLSMKTSAFEKNATKAKHHLNELTHGLGEFAGPIAGIAGAALSLYTLDRALEAAAEQSGAVRDLNLALENSKHAAGIGSAEIQHFARELQDSTKFADELTISAGAVLATFTNIRSPAMFKDALALSQDLAQFLKTDLTAAAMMVGRVLNDPAGAVKSLKGLGVTPAQRELIQHLAETGQVAAAQARTLDVLKEKFGGAAQAAGQGLGGSLAQLHHRLDDLREDMGRAVGPFVGDIIKAIDATRNHGRAILTASVALGAASAAMKLWALRTKAAAAAQAIFTALQGPKGWAQLAIGAAGAAVAIGFVEEKLKGLEETAESAGGSGKNPLADTFAAGDDAAAKFAKRIDHVRDTIKKFRDDLTTEADLLDPMFGGQMGEHEKAFHRMYRELVTSGGTAGQTAALDKAYDQVKELDALEKRLAIEKEIADLKKQADEFGLDAVGKELAALRAMGATAEQMAKAEKEANRVRLAELAKKNAEEEKKIRAKLAQDAKAVADRYATPSEALREELKQIRDLTVAGQLDPTKALEYMHKASQAKIKDLVGSFANINPGSGAFVRGTASAFSAEQAARRQNDPFKLLTDKQREQLIEMRETNSLLRQQVQALSNIHTAKVG